VTVEERTEMLALMQEAIQPINIRLDSIESKQDAMQNDIVVLNTKTDAMQNDIAVLNTKTDAMNGRIRSLELTIENETNKNIRKVAEGHLDLSRKLDKVLDFDRRVEKLEDEMVAMQAFLHNNVINAKKPCSYPRSYS